MLENGMLVGAEKADRQNQDISRYQDMLNTIEIDEGNLRRIKDEYEETKKILRYCKFIDFDLMGPIFSGYEEKIKKIKDEIEAIGNHLLEVQ